MKLQLVKYHNGWGYRTSNKGRILVHSEAYDNRSNAFRAGKSFIKEMNGAIVDGKLKIEILKQEVEIV